MSSGRGVVLLKTLIFTLVVPGTVLVYLPYWIATETAFLPRFNPGPVKYLASLPLTIGGLVYLWCAWDFATKGRGTPAPIDAPKDLVVQGLYRYVRNPMYVGGLTIIAGHVLWSGSLALLLYGLIFFAATHLFVLLYEEPTLRRKFGDSYVHYCRMVPRWIPTSPRQECDGPWRKTG